MRKKEQDQGLDKLSILGYSYISSERMPKRIYAMASLAKHSHLNTRPPRVGKGTIKMKNFSILPIFSIFFFALTLSIVGCSGLESPVAEEPVAEAEITPLGAENINDAAPMAPRFPGMVTLTVTIASSANQVLDLDVSANPGLKEGDVLAQYLLYKMPGGARKTALVQETTVEEDTETTTVSIPGTLLPQEAAEAVRAVLYIVALRDGAGTGEGSVLLGEK